MTATTTRAAETWAHILEQPDGLHMGYAADFATDDGSEPHEACAAVEAVAQQHLDAHPDDHRARRLLGEWLQWHGDARGEGMRALAVGRRMPWFGLGHPGTGIYLWTWFCGDSIEPDDLPSDWFLVTDMSKCADMSCHSPPKWADWLTRREAEDAAALAFARLPAERRAALLRGEM